MANIDDYMITKQINQIRQKLTEFWFIQTLERIKEFIQGTTCYISYARGISKYDKQIYKLSTHLKAAGVNVYLDKWNNRAGTKQSRFTERISKSEFVILVGSQQLMKEYGTEKNGSILNLEIDQIIEKLRVKPGSVIPIFLDGTKETALPLAMGTMVGIDFTHNKIYYEQVFQILEILCQGNDLSLFKKEFMTQKKYLYAKEHSLDILLQKEKEAEERDKALTQQITTNIINQYQTALDDYYLDREKYYVKQSLSNDVFLTLSDNKSIIGNFFNQMFRKIEKKSLVLLGILCIFFLCLVKCVSPKPESLTHPDLNIPSENVLLKRLNLIKKIDEKLEKRQKPESISVVALVGMGGVGKTILARYYARRHKHIIFWEINAETKNSLLTSLYDLAHALVKTNELREELDFIKKIQNAEERERQFLYFIKSLLRKHPDWLLIYDNFESFPEIEKYYPQDPYVWGQGKIIITTRNSTLVSSGYINSNNVIRIEELTQEEALALFSKILFNTEAASLPQDKKVEAIEFLKHIPSFPLDITIAAKYLKSTQHLSYKEYLKHLTQYDQDFDRTQQQIASESIEYTKTRYNIIRISLEKILKDNKEFQDLLLFICLLNSQNIPISLLERYKNSIIIENLIFNLKKYSLITNTSDAPHYKTHLLSMHRSTQKISLDFLKNYLSLNKNTFPITSIASTVVNFMSDVARKEDSRMKLAIAHGKAFLSHKDLLNDLTIAEINLQLGRIYHYAGAYHKSIEQYEKSMQIYEEKLGRKDIKTAEVFLRIGDLFTDIGDYQKSQYFLERGYLVFKKHYGETHIKTGWALSLLGSIYRRIGEYKKATSCLEQSLSIYKMHKDDYDGTALIKIRYAKVLKDIGKYKEAKILLEQALAVLTKTYGANHNLIAYNLLALGSVNIKLKDYDAAKTILTRSLGIHKVFFGSDSLESAYTMRYLGVVYTYLKQYKEAADFFQKVHQIYTKHFGEDHVSVSQVLMDTGQLYFSNNMVQEAEHFFNRALIISAKNKHPGKYRCLEALGDLYNYKKVQALKEKNIALSQAHKIKSIEYFQEVLKILKEYFPNDSPHIKRVQEKLLNE
jgi:tetratricopeptide (TPR) repeat protein